MEKNNTTLQDNGSLLQKGTFYLAQLAEMVLQDAKTSYEETNSFTPQIYQQLNSVFGDILIPALDILDRYKFIKYKLINEKRCIFKLTSRSEQFTLHEDIHFCTCLFFTEKVFKNGEALMCAHVLALKLAHIVGCIRDEVISNAQMKSLLDNQMYNCLGFKGFDQNAENEES